MLVRDYYRDCILFEETLLAYCIYHLLAEKKISLEDDASRIDFNQADLQKVAEMVQNNVLGFHKIDIYSLKMDKATFFFIYAGSREEAIQFYTQSFQKTPLNCHEYPLEFELTRGNGVITFRDMKKEFLSFPAIVGCFMKQKYEKDS